MTEIPSLLTRNYKGVNLTIDFVESRQFRLDHSFGYHRIQHGLADFRNNFRLLVTIKFLLLFLNDVCISVSNNLNKIIYYYDEND